MFSEDEIERYARHIVLRDVGGPGQRRLKDARVLVVGAGGLGSPLILYLAAAGVGTIGIVDDDVVSLSNLQRQIAFGDEDIGRPKAACAAAAASRLNREIAAVPHGERLAPDNVHDLVGRYDLVADGSDNVATRYLVADACTAVGRPLVTAALGAFDGAITTIRGHERGPDGRRNPTYRCLFPEPPAEDGRPTCAQAGVLGALAGLMGSLMALEVIREIVGFGDGLVGRLLMVDARSLRFETIRYVHDPTNPLTGASPPADAHG